MKDKFENISKKEARKLFKTGIITEEELFQIQKERTREYQKEYSKTHRQQKIETKRRYYEKNREHCLEYQKEYDKIHRKEINKRIREKRQQKKSN